MKLKPTESMSAGVVLERRKIDNPWQDFVDGHHVDVPFKKRKREPYDPRRGGFARNPGRGGNHG